MIRWIKKVSVRFTNEEYEILVEYAKNHDLSITQAIKLSLKMDIPINSEIVQAFYPSEGGKDGDTKDGKGRALRKGESYRKSEGRTRYSYCYTDPFGKKVYLFY